MVFGKRLGPRNLAGTRHGGYLNRYNVIYWAQFLHLPAGQVTLAGC